MVTLGSITDISTKKQELFEILVSYAAEDYDSSQAAYLMALINGAINEICRELRRTDFEDGEARDAFIEYVLSKYDDVILKIAEYHYDKQGKQGVLSWTESGAQASYECAGTPKSLFVGIYPTAAIV